MSQTDPVAFWNQAYESGEFRQRWHSSEPSSELAALIASGIAPAGARVLDIGCGAGIESIFLAQCGFRTLGIDIAADAIAVARAAAGDLDVHFQVADITNLGDLGDLGDDDADGAFQFINDRGVFHLFDRAGRAAYAAQVGRVLAPGGALAIRGTRVDGTDAPYKAVTAESIDEHFPASHFSRGPLVPMYLLCDHSSLPGYMVVVRKRQQPARPDGGVQVQGLGGVFFKASDPKALQAWYVRHLGLPVDENGYVDLRWRPLHDPARTAQIVWSAFKRDTQYFAPGEADHMFNFRVADLHAALARLRADGVTVMDDVEESEYGKFGWCLDGEGNKIELWQPPD